MQVKRAPQARYGGDASLGRSLQSLHVAYPFFLLWAPENLPDYPPPPLQSPPPGGEPSLGPKSIENTRNTRHQRCQRKFVQGAEADLHCGTMVQFCVAIPPPHPQGGEPSLHDPPPPWGGTGLTKGGRLQGGGVGPVEGVGLSEQRNDQAGTEWTGKSLWVKLTRRARAGHLF